MEEFIEIIKIIFHNPSEEALEFGIQFAGLVLGIIASIIGIILMISLWRIFKKAGQKPWKCFIPVYNFIVLYKISGISPLLLLTFMLQFIPQISLIGFIIWNIVDATQKSLLAKKFHKSIWFVVGMILFDFIFYPILAFGTSKYTDTKDDKNHINENI